ncbi:hypothetical protein DFH06DRAFT_3269 [Mycena polygramma]|nr:hypothetical protein DFH06DRAFT_3269 [Mycena polygramma]
MTSGNNSPSKPKGTHGGARPGAGRRPNPNKVQKPAQKTVGAPPRAASRQHPQATGSTGSTGSSGICGENNHYVSCANPTSGSGTSFYASTGTCRPEDTTVEMASDAHRDTLDTSDSSQSTSHQIPPQQLTQPDEQLDFNDRTGTDRRAPDSAQVSGPHDYLKSVRDRLVREQAEARLPVCYSRGDFFERAPHPVFALENMVGSGLTHESMYHLDVFVWLPDLLPGCPDTFKCVCGLSLCRNGYNDDPIARRVRATPSDFFLFTNRFICDPRRTNVTGCGMNFQGTDLHIVSQLPRFVQLALPGIMSF